MMLSSKRCLNILFSANILSCTLVENPATSQLVTPVTSKHTVDLLEFHIVLEGIIKTHKYKRSIYKSLGFTIKKEFQDMLYSTNNQIHQNQTAVLTDRELDLLKTIETLNLSNFNLLKLPMSVINHMPKLTELDISGNHNLAISEKDVSALGEKIQSVIVNSVYSSSDIFRSIISLPLLTSLDISNNNFAVMCMRANDSSDKGNGDSSNSANGDSSNRSGVNPSQNEPSVSMIRSILQRFQNFFRSTGNNDEIKKIVRGLKLKSLRASNCDIDGNFFEIIGSLKTLEALDLSNNLTIKNTIPENIGELLKSVTHLKLSNCGLSSTDFERLCTCPALIHLNVRRNTDIWENIDNTKDIFKYIKDRLVYINLKDTNMTKRGLELLLEFTKLETIDMHDNKGLGEHITSDFDFSNLLNTVKSLNIENINLRASGIKAIGKFKGIEWLNMSNISGPWDYSITMKDFLPMLTNLKEFYIRGFQDFDCKVICDIQESYKLLKLFT